MLVLCSNFVPVDSKSRSAEERVAESSEDKETDLSPAVEAVSVVISLIHLTNRLANL